MAIAFGRVKRVSRSAGGNACCKGAYNARSRIVDEKTGEVFDFTKRGGNVYHEILLPDYVDKKFKNPSVLMNEVERIECKENSQLLKEFVLALPDDKNISLELKKEMVLEFIKEMKWIEEGLGVQIDIHEPHEDEKNWHAHLLLTLRRFLDHGKCLGAKARDLEPQVRGGRNNTYVKSNEEINIGRLWSEVQNKIFKKHGLENRVDVIGKNAQEHIGSVRMRSIMNEAVHRNEERKEANIEYLNSSSRLIERITEHASVFNRKDLMRAVKIVPDSEVRAKLVEDALSSKSLINLYDEVGKDTGYYTTTEIRSEEEKILRLSGYVANQKNVVAGGSGMMGHKSIQQLLDNNKSGFSEEQQKALSNLLLEESGIRILRGRAGAGKSYVLKEFANIVTSNNVHVIGLAPTHKAKMELASEGFECVDTVKGMLFKLANGRFNLPKHSVLVLDEAGMVGNNDYKELLRVAATRQCNVILSMDEKQLTSVQRGGMGEVFADRYGSSTILDIKRQDSNWGRSVAMSMSNGCAETGISILEQENRIKWSSDAESSMQSLLSDWNKSDYAIGDRVILAVRNKDVVALNHGVREYLKMNGKLTGEEIAVGGNHYMKGDRILITKTNKELGVINGDIAEIRAVSKDEFTIRFVSDNNENNKEISFNPSEYHGFRHGYATTIFKAQGASIRDVYLLHNGFAGIRNSYVGLSRHISELNLYINKEATSSIKMLIKQLSHDAEAGSSLAYLTKEELESRALGQRLANNNSRFVRGVNSLIDFVGNTATKIADKYLPSAEYYNYREPKQKVASVELVIDKVYQEMEQKNQAINLESEKLIVGGYSIKATTTFKDNINQNIITAGVINGANTDNERVANSKVIQSINDIGAVKTRQSSKSRFYAHADYVRSKRQYDDQKEEWNKEYVQLQSEIRFKAESIAKDLLGLPNKQLSNGRELRFGGNGKIVVRITGEKAGTWYDFSAEKGGDLFDLVRETKGGDFKDATNYLKNSVGMKGFSNSKANLKLVHDHSNSNFTAEYIKNRQLEQQELEKKQLFVTKLYTRSKEVTKATVAHRYLTNQRSIECQLSEDVKTAGIYSKEKNRYLPALIAFAKDKEGNITGGQYILLKASGTKANVDIPRKSFGKISGSFVDLGSNGDKNKEKSIKPEITIIAEGLETALSVAQALREHSAKTEKTLCSLGISNIKNYQPKLGEKIIIAADNDGANSVTNKTIENAKIALQEKGAYVEIVRPEKEGDFNDVLKLAGTKAIAQSFKPAIDRHNTKTLDEYIVNNDQNLNSELTKEDKLNLAHIEKYDLSQEKILNAWRVNIDKGKNELSSLYSKILSAEKAVDENQAMFDLAKNYNIEVDKKKLVVELMNSEKDSESKSLKVSGEKECITHILTGFNKQKTNSEKIGQVFTIIKKEDSFLSEVSLTHQKDLDQPLQDRIALSKTGKSQDVLASIKTNLEANHKQGIISYDDLLKKVIAGGYDIKGLEHDLQSMAITGRKIHCQVVRLELAELEKLYPQYDTDSLISILKSKSYEGKNQYINKVLAEHTKKYIEPLFAKHDDEKTKATNFTEYLHAVEKEQKTYVDLNNHYPLAIYAIDKQNGNIKLSYLVSSANDLHKKIGIRNVMRQIKYAVKNNITTSDQVIKELKTNGGNLKSLYTALDEKCQSHGGKLMNYSKEQEKEHEPTKSKGIKINKDFSM